MAKYRPRSGTHWNDCLTNIRCEAGVSRRELADMAGVSYDTIYEVETGNRSPNQAVIDAFGRLAEGLRSNHD